MNTLGLIIYMGLLEALPLRSCAYDSTTSFKMTRNCGWGCRCICMPWWRTVSSCCTRTHRMLTVWSRSTVFPRGWIRAWKWKFAAVSQAMLACQLMLRCRLPVRVYSEFGRSSKSSGVGIELWLGYVCVGDQLSFIVLHQCHVWASLKHSTLTAEIFVTLGFLLRKIKWRGLKMMSWSLSNFQWLRGQDWVLSDLTWCSGSCVFLKSGLTL